MAIVTLHLSTVKAYTESRPSRCPHCGSGLLQRWGGCYKPVRDTQIRAAIVYRYRCTGCRRTFRHYPEGIGQADQSIRLVQLAAIGWTLGLSLRGMSAILSAFGVTLAHMTVWRDAQAMAKCVKPDLSRRKVRVLGVDGFYTRLKGKPQGNILAVDLGNGQTIALAQIEESDTHAVVEWLQPLVVQLGVEVIVTDDLASLGVAVERVGCKRQICRFHALRWIGRTIKELRSQLDEDWQESLDEVQRVVHDLPPDGQRLLYMLWQRIGERRGPRNKHSTALYRLRQLALRLSEHWDEYTLFQSDPVIPPTNNATEQAILPWRMRSRTTRGFKSWAGLEAAFVLCGNDLA
jgi:transposase-like protein